MTTTRKLILLNFSENGSQSCQNLQRRLQNQLLGINQNTEAPVKLLAIVVPFVYECPDNSRGEYQLLSRIGEDDLKWREIPQPEGVEDNNPSDEFSGETGGVPITNVLHKLADSLPYTGDILDIVMEMPPLEKGSKSTLAMYGCLRRLQEWHNGRISVVCSQAAMTTETMDTCLGEGLSLLEQFISISRLGCFEEFELDADLCWRGKISVIDKTVNRGFILPGFEIKRSNDAVCAKQNTKGEILSGHILGRTLEVLQEVDIITIPTFMLTNHHFKVHLRKIHPYSEVFYEQITSNSQCGLITRLAWYPTEASLPQNVDRNLGEATWRDSIISNITFVQEPEEELLPGAEYLHLLLRPGRGDDSHVLYATEMRSPRSLSHGLVDMLVRQGPMLNISSQTKEFVQRILDGLPVMTPDVIPTFRKILADVFLESNTGSLSGDDLNKWLNDRGQEIWKELLPLLAQYSCDSSAPFISDVTKICSAVQSEDMIPACDWPERKMLQYRESQGRSLSRLQSTDSMALSSPLQCAENRKSSSVLDMWDVLKLFRPDGSAQAENLSPIRKKNPGHLRKTLVPSEEELAGEGSVYMASCCHGTHYNHDKKAEKLEIHLAKLHDKFIPNETESSHSKKKFILCKRTAKSANQKASLSKPKHKSPLHRKSTDKVGLKSPRRSPRKSLKTLPSAGVAKEPKRELRKESPQTLTGSQKLPQRSPRKSTSQSSIISEQKARRLSRSERHKKKLEDIVIAVLAESGVKTDGPIFKSCFTRLYRVTKLYVMDLPTSENLRQEMRTIAQGQVSQVIQMETKRLSTK